MKFYLTDTNEHKNIEIRTWVTGSGYGSDCFDDLEPNFPREHEIDENSGEIICTSSEYRDLLAWWEEEVRCMNAHELGELHDYSEVGTDDEFVIITGD